MVRVLRAGRESRTIACIAALNDAARRVKELQEHTE